ncbi:molybdopterin-synthase adenylyltransferase MoeB [bacterium]|jgi:sulfur-carrier protein adenylyltransferase/sulfurtransferase|nr:molybdopterin-synthase adenylyltransferase MoeB [bacterium]
MSLSPDELRRYHRHLVLPEVGEKGQSRLCNSAVLVVGAGGLGAPALSYLSAAGVGRIGIYDGDRVDESNLQRQVLFTVEDVGGPKAEIAASRLELLNPFLKFEAHNENVCAQQALEIISGYDLVLDCTDNFPTRYILNDACVLGSRPLISAAIYRFEGQFSVFCAPEGPCYRCLYPKPPPAGLVPDCSAGGVLGVLPGVLGSLQATEAIKILLNIGKPAIGRLILYDALATRFREMNIAKNPECLICSENPQIDRVVAEEMRCSMTMGPEVAEISVEELSEYRKEGRDFLLVDVREPFELDIARLDPVIEIPLGELESRFEELDDQAEVVVMCRSGKRSATACEFLMKKGFVKVSNLAGGILEWSARIDPSIQRY